MIGFNIILSLLAVGTTHQRSGNHDSATQTSADQLFHKWCSDVGIETPMAALETTPRSVAGRGVFATNHIRQGDVVVSIPENVVLHEYNAASSFPELGKRLFDTTINFEKDEEKKRRWWGRLSKCERQKKYEFTDSSDLWQGTLTEFSLACLETNDHPWKPWILQWQRDDPIQTLFKAGVTWRDESSVLESVEKLSAMLPEADKTKLRAAVEMRLGRLEELRYLFGASDKFSDVFGVLTSRAIDLGDGVCGVLPMFDMINHSNKPNLALSFGEGVFSLWALEDIEMGDELFVSYNEKSTTTVTWDENDAIWMLIQWGIPIRRRLPELVDFSSSNSQQEAALAF